jgi:MoaA/NifB/PqqE/SkfB family radical SAM enzyme
VSACADHRRSILRLPLVTLYVTERCNSRCRSCDYWQHGRIDISLESVRQRIAQLVQLGTRVVVLSGGEPLVHADWATIADCLRSNGMQVWLLTAGLALAKHARRAAALFDSITVSMDGTDRATYAAIRGLDAFENVCEGVRAAVSHGKAPSLRVTLQRDNFQQIGRFVDLGKELGAREVSFLAVDVANSNAFGRNRQFASDLALRPEDLPVFSQLLDSLECTHAKDFGSGFIAEAPQKLRRILQYFGAVNGIGSYPPVRCNALEFSAVIGADGKVKPCFFIPAPKTSAPIDDFTGMLNSPEMLDLREQIRAGRRTECKACVCSMWRELARA